MATKIRSASLAGVRGLALTVVSLTGSVILFAFTIVSIVLILIGVVFSPPLPF